MINVSILSIMYSLLLTSNLILVTCEGPMNWYLSAQTEYANIPAFDDDKKWIAFKTKYSKYMISKEKAVEIAQQQFYETHSKDKNYKVAVCERSEKYMMVHVIFYLAENPKETINVYSITTWKGTIVGKKEYLVNSQTYSSANEYVSSSKALDISRAKLSQSFIVKNYTYTMAKIGNYWFIEYYQIKSANSLSVTYFINLRDINNISEYLS
jgi:hypothetical protein